MRSPYGFDLRSLDVFIQLAESGNMTTIAQRLGASQSSISQILTALEDGLSVQLLDRSVRPMELTTAGRFLYDRGVPLLKQVKKTGQDIRCGDFKRLFHVRIALVDSLMSAIGKPLLDVVEQRTGEWSVQTGQSHVHAHAIRSRNTDIIISDDGLEDYNGLIRHRILKEPLLLITPKSHSHHLDNLNTLARELHMVRYTDYSLIGQQVERILRQQGISPHPRLYLDNTSAILNAVASGCGWTITTPLCLYQLGSRIQQLVSVGLLPGESPCRELTLIAREGELDDLPQTIANDARQILKNRFYPTMTEQLMWLQNHIEIG
ncbi:LysR family transcriptional regulator [Sansalvadorimonas sp. 2012CJ34-2]|uniref:LysR family transcriptional regulator n=1 Tax=Parendozoicomonas callyspongiae TaxID=2942213 RepID=A0ABT0PCN8_9GAMM|nr:LysR family transcriptional regulator [Sansalvadorimonas sp. 2012CJ34-2]MCL6269148.1 LysR family transcriptional regulator [Sansalvadorimonas sp. 2012CJ34-2]